MPVVSVKRDLLHEALGEVYEQAAFEDLCFDFGIELDDVTSERAEIEKEVGKQSDKLASASDEVIYKIDIPANRYDLLCLEGIAKALRVFLQKDATPPTYKVLPGTLTMTREASVSDIRPHVVCAILRNITFTPASYRSFIDVQDKFHQNIGRNRSLVSIGTHDLDKIQAPFFYRALPPTEIHFTPLNRTQEMDGPGVMAALESDLHLKRYLHLIRDSPVYPVIYDSAGKVLSLPPIINGEYSKMSADTRNVLIEVTATDLTKANIVLNNMCAMFSSYCAEPYTMESMSVVDEAGQVVHASLPDMSYRQTSASLEYIRGLLDLQIPVEEITTLLNKMMLPSSPSEDGKDIHVQVPPTRSDILHQCDIAEDVAIAYGYNNLNIVPPNTVTTGGQQPLNMLCDLLRYEMAFAGYTEVLSFALCSREENYKFFRREEDNLCVTIGNPKTVEFQIGRTTLLVGLMKTLASNKQLPLPIKLYEIADVILKDSSSDVGAINQRRLAVVYCDAQAGFEKLHGVVDLLMLKLGVSVGRYHLDAEGCRDEALFPGMRSNIVVDGQQLGVIGVLHPEVVLHFGLNCPVSICEIQVERFV